MSSELITRTLSSLPFFAKLPRDLSEKVAACASLCEFEAGDVIFEQGDECVAFYAVAEGLI